MIFAKAVDALDSDNEGMEEMERLKGTEFSSSLALQELTEKLPLDVLRDEDGDRVTPKRNGLLGVILNENGTWPQLVELPSVKVGSFVTNVPLGKEQFCGALDFGISLPDSIDLSLPTRAELGHDFVLASDDSTRLKVEAVNGNIRFRYHKLN